MLKKREGFAGQRSYVMPLKLLEITQNHRLCQDLYVTDIGYYPRASFHTRERAQGCPQYILIYCEMGEGWYILNNKKYIVKPHQFFILPANVRHAYGADMQNPWTIYWVHFTGILAEHYINYLYKGFDMYVPLPISAEKNRNLLFNNIISHIEMSYSDDDVVYANTSFRHYLTTFKDAIYNPSHFEQTQNDPISLAISHMKEHLSEALTLEQIAAVAGMSPSYFSVIFRQKIQSSPIHFFTFLKNSTRLSSIGIHTISHQRNCQPIGLYRPFPFQSGFYQYYGQIAKGI
ncbi:MAG: AraC family transcriptional regulator [Saprospiraceae bacterium]|nr:AraC family transcriptional regulator [Saprospiraceae bacterium]